MSPEPPSDEETDLEASEERVLTRFVPIQRQELVNLLHQELVCEPTLQEDFIRFANLLQQTLHFEFNQTLERLRSAYRTLDPDPITPSVLEQEPEPDPAPFLREFRHLLEQANFRQVTPQELDHAFQTRSLFPLDTMVDLEEFSEVLLFRRGRSRRQERIRGLTTWYRWKEVEIESFDRLVLALRLKPEALEHHRKTQRVKGMKVGKLYLKYFKNIPTADLEMVFPNTQLRMGSLDRVKVGLPILSGLGTAGIKLLALAGLALGAGTLASTDDTSLQATGALLAALAGYMLRSFNGYKNTKLNYMQTISQGLYFKNLDNNAGVVHHMLSAAEQEETKEALLAYFFLLKAQEPLTKGGLDVRIERWFATRFDRHFDFEVEDGLAKLRRLRLVERDDQGWKAVGLPEALRRLDQAWDGYFDYQNE